MRTLISFFITWVAGALLAASAWWFTAVKTVGGLYLVWLGWRMLRAGVGPAEVALPAAPDSLWRLFANTWLVTALNPKSITFFVAFVPQFVDRSAPFAPQAAVMVATFVVLAFANAFTYAFVATRARATFANARAIKIFNRTGGTLLMGAGVATAVIRT